jgi:hypothetical protein
MSPVLLSNRIKSFPAPFIFVKRNMHFVYHTSGDNANIALKE